MQKVQFRRQLASGIYLGFAGLFLGSVLFTSQSFGQLTTYRINSAPDTPLKGTNVSDYDTYALTSSLMTGATVDLPWTQADSGTTSNCPNVSFTTYDGSLSTLLTDGHPSGKFTNFIVMPVQEGGAGKGSNTFTPSYVFTQAWANNLANAGTCAGITSPSWAAGESVLPGNYIFVNSRYWQETNQPWSSSAPFVGTCTTGSTEPAFSSGVSSYSDNNCTWTNVGTNAPPQDACFSSYYPGDGVILAANSNNPGCFNVNNLPAGTTITNLETGFLVSYETPMKVAWKNLIQQAILHYQTSPPTNLTLGYIRFGLSEGGETVPLVSSSWPYFRNPTGKGPASGASIVYLSYVNEMMQFQNANNKQNGGDPPINMQADLNTWQGVTDYPDQEALYATQNNIGIGTNGLQVADVTTISPPSGTCTSVNANISGDWCYNFHKYCSTKMPNGNYPICSLQTLLRSTPGNNNAVVNGNANTGSLSDEYWNNGTSWANFYGLIPTAKLYGANNLEIYTCDILFTVMYAFPTNNYPGTSNCDTGTNPLPPNDAYEVDYQDTFLFYINSNAPGIYSPVPGSSTTTDSTVTLHWNTFSGATSYNVQVGSSEGTQNFYHNANTPNGVTVHFTAQPSGTDIWLRWTPNNGNSIDFHYVTP
jgi:hypothetical protein